MRQNQQKELVLRKATHSIVRFKARQIQQKFMFWKISNMFEREYEQQITATPLPTKPEQCDMMIQCPS
jgi:hypothetical protein